MLASFRFFLSLGKTGEFKTAANRTALKERGPICCVVKVQSVRRCSRNQFALGLTQRFSIYLWENIERTHVTV
ncbi:hypothetical protein CLOSTMETH_02057 [[Clostridium] methylpentosum DSM 5476]|uniref:Uncharacterized protein n=1 Tax=[Clostridium] methylpentosum DSM 5476 TaxID=537013 RepID=C0EDX8_9FIRM|nr:hypothetical protein CLOSTMETH_02057 [[Clostridium] methylpentosum DSM 5476]